MRPSLPQIVSRLPPHLMDDFNNPPAIEPGAIRMLHGAPAFISSLLPYAALLSFAIAVLWPLCHGQCLYWGDILLYFEPMQRFEQRLLLQGHFPLWNPLIHGGQPFVGNPQMGVFYPGTLLLPILPTWVYTSLSTIVHLTLCGVGAYRYLLRWSRTQIAPLAGGLVYMGSACLLGRLQFPPMVQTAVYLPFLLATLDTYMDHVRESRGDRQMYWRVLSCLLWLSVLVALTTLAAHPQLSYLSFACATLYAVARWLRGYQVRHHKFRATGVATSLCTTLIPLALAMMLGLFIAAVQLLPAFQLLIESSRERMTVGQANRFVLDPEGLLTLVMPYFFGHPAHADYWGGGNAWEPALFIGWLPLFFIAVGIRRYRHDWLARFWIFILVTCLWLALGIVGGLFTLAFTVVPGISKFHDPARFLFLVTFAAGALTSVGIDAWWERRRRAPGVAPAVILLIALPLGWFGQVWNPTIPNGLFRFLMEHRDIAPTGPGRLYMPRHKILWKQYVTDGYPDYGLRTQRALTEFTVTNLPNLPMEFGQEMASGYEPVPIVAATDLDGLVGDADRRSEPNFPRLVSLLGVSTVVLPASQSIHYPEFEKIQWVGAARLPVRYWRRIEVSPTAWLVTRTRRVDGKRRIAAALADPGFDPRREAIVSGVATALPTERNDWQGGQGSADANAITGLKRSNNRIDLIANAGHYCSFLVITATLYPGWKAVVDGHIGYPIRADGALVGLSLGPGMHSIQFRYQPDVFRVGQFLTLCSLGALCCGSTLAIFRGIAFRKRAVS